MNQLLTFPGLAFFTSSALSAWGEASTVAGRACRSVKASHEQPGVTEALQGAKNNLERLTKTDPQTALCEAGCLLQQGWRRFREEHRNLLLCRLQRFLYLFLF